MEKQGVVRPGLTPDTENKCPPEKRASQGARVEALDNDLAKRLADAAAKKPAGN